MAVGGSQPKDCVSDHRQNGHVTAQQGPPGGTMSAQLLPKRLQTQGKGEMEKMLD